MASHRVACSTKRTTCQRRRRRGEATTASPIGKVAHRGGGDITFSLICVLFRAPTHAGGLFAIDREWFKEVGWYDPGLWVWGGENFELSFKVRFSIR